MTDAPPWSEIDKVRFFGIGTAMYSGLSVLLHPVTVIKINQQNSKGLHQPSLKETIRSALSKNSSSSSSQRTTSLDRIRPLYRGLGVVLSLAVPARAVYIGVLEGSREGFSAILSPLLAQPEVAATVSSGLAGGFAAVVAQSLVVPMDVVSQKQMVMNSKDYANGEGSAMSVIKSIIKTDGWKGLFRGFGLSIVSSLPAGSIWWAVYGGCQVKLNPYSKVRLGEEGSLSHVYRKCMIQLVAGVSAAVVAATLTQPLDTVKTRVQVSSGESYRSIATELAATSGVAGFFKGTGPRLVHMSIWGTVLSSAYELLRHVSRKENS